jgi:protein O-mannosyl-transferase
MTTTQLDPATEERSATTAAPASRLSLRLSSRELTLLLALALVTATLALYEPALHNGFVNYDDPDYITDNPHVLHGLSLDNVRWAMTATAASNWHPLTWIVHMADVDFLGVKPTGHHLVSVGLHTLNGVLLFLLLRFATGYVWRSAAVAALFALFPLNVQTVAWAAELKSVLCTTFLLLALFAYGWYARRPDAGRYLLLALLFALSLMAKPTAITLPLALLVVDYWPLRRFGGKPSANAEPEFARAGYLRLALEKIPLLALSAGSAAMTVYAQRRGGALAPADLFPLALRIKNAIVSYAVYMGKGVWPSRLAVFYPYPKSLALVKVALAALILVAITAVVFRYRERRYLVVGWLWYLGTMVPMIGIVQAGRQAIADRYAYVPFLGLFVMAVWLAADLAQRSRAARTAVGVLALAVMAVYASVSHAQIGYWRNSYQLFSHALDVTTGNAVAEDNLGVAYEKELHAPAQALLHYQAAVRLMPDLPTAHYDLGTALQSQGRLDEAAREYRLTLQYATNPADAGRAHNNLGVIYMQTNQPQAAISEFDEALRSDPTQVFSLLNRGSLEYRLGELGAARRDLMQAVQITSNGAAWLLLGRVLEDQGQLESAAIAYQNSLKLSPGIGDAQERLNGVLHKLGR